MTPTQVPVTRSNMGNLKQCLERLKKLINWNKGQYIQISDRKSARKGYCFLHGKTLQHHQMQGQGR